MPFFSKSVGFGALTYVLVVGCSHASQGAPKAVAPAPVTVAEETQQEPLPTLPPRGPVELVEVSAFGDKLVTSAAVTSDGRRFVNFPRWFQNQQSNSLMEMDKDGKVTAYPNAAWNDWKEGAAVEGKFISATSITIDGQGKLWVLDSGAPGGSKVLPGAAKLVAIDLAKNEVVATIPFDARTAPASAQLNDLRIDAASHTAYVSDGKTRVVVVDLASGSATSVGNASATARR